MPTADQPVLTSANLSDKNEAAASNAETSPDTDETK
jgi:hypothetical protein